MNQLINNPNKLKIMKTTLKYMKPFAATFAIFAATISVFAQTDNLKLTLPEFTSIVISSPMEVKLSQGTENSVSISEGNIQDIIKAEVKDNVLYLKGKPEELTINFIKLNKIQLLANSDVESINQINSDKLEIYLKGAASDIDLDLNVNELFSSIEGAGDIKYKGIAGSHVIEIKGAGDVNAYNLVTTSTNITISGVGDAKVNVVQDLKGTINGAGDIKYLSEPATKDIKVNGVGSYGLKGLEKNLQTDKTKNNYDTIKFNLGDYNVYMIKDSIGVNGIEKPKRDTAKNLDKFNIYWSGIGIGVNGYLNANNETKVPLGYDFLELNYPKSINVSLNFCEQKIPI